MADEKKTEEIVEEKKTTKKENPPKKAAEKKTAEKKAPAKKSAEKKTTDKKAKEDTIVLKEIEVPSKVIKETPAKKTTEKKPAEKKATEKKTPAKSSAKAPAKTSTKTSSKAEATLPEKEGPKRPPNKKAAGLDKKPKKTTKKKSTTKKKTNKRKEVEEALGMATTPSQDKKVYKLPNIDKIKTEPQQNDFKSETAERALNKQARKNKRSKRSRIFAMLVPTAKDSVMELIRKGIVFICIIVLLYAMSILIKSTRLENKANAKDGTYFVTKYVYSYEAYTTVKED